MKRIISAFIAMAICCGSVMAQDITSKIEKANALVKNVESKFTLVKTIKASGKTINSEGTLYYKAEGGKLAMRYSKPAGELLIVNGNRFYMNKGGHASNFDISKNAMIGGIANTLTGCIKGCPSKVAADSKGGISSVETAAGYEVTITPAAQNGRRSYSKIMLTYRKSDSLLVKMVLVEPTGITSVYEMTGLKKNTSFPEDVFKIPSRQ